MKGFRGRRIWIYEWFSEIFKKKFFVRKNVKEALFSESINIWYSFIKGFRGRRIWILGMVFRNFEKISSFEKTLRMRYLEKLLIFHKNWWKVFLVVVSESKNSFSKFWKNLFVWKNATEALFEETIDIS